MGKTAGSRLSHWHPARKRLPARNAEAQGFTETDYAIGQTAQAFNVGVAELVATASQRKT
ncbi:MAG: hypothetical protein QXL10_01045 [Candidatus Bathyarchaeia archaeon]